jgi:DNA-binding CsgD family transcriptional regulator
MRSLSSIAPLGSNDRAGDVREAGGLAGLTPLLPLLVISVPEGSVRASNRGAAELFGCNERQLLHRRLHDLVDASELAMSREALAALASGAIDSFRAHRLLTTAQGPTLSSVWVRSIPRTSGAIALVLVLPADEIEDASASSGQDSSMRPTTDLAAGTMRSGGEIVTLARTDAGVLGESIDDVGAAPQLTRHVHPEDRQRFQAVLDRFERDLDDVIAQVRVDHAQHEWVASECHLFATGDGAGGEPIGFVLSEVSAQPAAPAARLAQLEEHIDRIADEVRAAGVTVGPANSVGDVPSISLGGLTSRQRDIVDRLLSGARVTTIAAALYISPSTVRNHLSAVYRTAHVHSQAELIELLRPGG